MMTFSPSRVRFSLLAVFGILAAAALGQHLFAQPPTTSASPPSRGKEVYDSHCVECHGSEGKGDGPAAHLMTPRPRDFTRGRYKIRSTESGSVPTDDDLLRSVRQGLYASTMPGWQKILPDDDIRAVVTYVKTFSPRFAAEPPVLIPTSSPSASSS